MQHLPLGLLLICVLVHTVFASPAVDLMLPHAGLKASDITTNLEQLILKYMKPEVQPEALALIQESMTVSSQESSSQSGSGTESTLVGQCEVCVFVVENKEQHQPYLCRGLKDPAYQTACVQVLESLLWWLTNQVYWLNYGCQQTTSASEWVRPCPAHAVCSWIENLYNHQPFCPADPMFRKPQ